MHLLRVVAPWQLMSTVHGAGGRRRRSASFTGGVLCAHVRRGAAVLRRGEEVRVDARKVLLGDHALDEHRTDHASKPDDAYSFHLLLGANVARDPGDRYARGGRACW